MTPQSKTDKLYMRGKDIFLLLVGGGGLISLVHIWETPKKLEDLTARVALTEAFANTLDKKQAVMESNLENETKLLNMMQETQAKMWIKINSK